MTEPPQSYSIQGFRDLLERRGPLWVAAAVPGLHAIVVTGMYSDGTSVCVRVTDPWDRQVGTPGAPGAYAKTHATGSRYIMTWDDFVKEYEAAATDFSRVNLQILHADSTAGRTANYGSAASAGYAQAVQRRPSRATSLKRVVLDQLGRGAGDRAADRRELLGDRGRDGRRLARPGEPLHEAIAEISGPHDGDRPRSGPGGAFAAELGLVAEPPQCYTVDGFRQLLESNGPLWVGAAFRASTPSSSPVSTATARARSCGSPIRGIATSAGRARRAYATTHATGSRYIITWEDFVSEYEAAATDFRRQPADPPLGRRSRPDAELRLGDGRRLCAVAADRTRAGDSTEADGDSTARRERHEHGRSLTRRTAPGDWQRRRGVAGRSINTTACAEAGAGSDAVAPAVDRSRATSTTGRWSDSREGDRAAAAHGVLATPGWRVGDVRLAGERRSPSTAGGWR